MAFAGLLCPLRHRGFLHVALACTYCRDSPCDYPKITAAPMELSSSGVGKAPRWSVRTYRKTGRPSGVRHAVTFYRRSHSTKSHFSLSFAPRIRDQREIAGLHITDRQTGRWCRPVLRYEVPGRRFVPCAARRGRRGRRVNPRDQRGSLPFRRRGHLDTRT